MPQIIDMKGDGSRGTCHAGSLRSEERSVGHEEEERCLQQRVLADTGVFSQLDILLRQ